MAPLAGSFPCSARKRLIAWKHECEGDLPQGEACGMGVEQRQKLDEPVLTIGRQMVRRALFDSRRKSNQPRIYPGRYKAKCRTGRGRHREACLRASGIMTEKQAVADAGHIKHEMAPGSQLPVVADDGTGWHQGVWRFVRAFENDRACTQVGVPDSRTA